MNMSPLVITGSYPDDICGVGDYTHALLDALKAENKDAALFYRKRWDLRDLREYLLLIKQTGSAVVNIQYPTEGYGYSILPQLLCCCLRKTTTVVTLHEFSRKSLKGKVAISLFFLAADWIIFTADLERDYVCRIAPWVRRRSCVIPISSNIPIRSPQAREADIVYFGLIRPEKGLEEFVNIIQKLSSRPELVTRVIGQLVPGYEQYASAILDRLRNVGAEIILGKTVDEVSQLLCRARVALLPFPDGMSLRRGSALAAMGNGALLITTPATSEAEVMKGICVMSATEDGLAAAVLRAVDGDPSLEAIRLAGQDFARNTSWSTVTSSYAKVMNRYGVWVRK